MASIKDRAKNFFRILKQTFKHWSDREPFNNAIIISYYTIFSLPGLLVIIINLVGYFFGKEAVTNQLTGQIGGIVGGDSAQQIQDMVASTSTSEGTTLATIISIATLLFGATGVFYQLQQILNKMWEVQPQPKQQVVKIVKDRVFSLGLILVVGFLLLVSLALSAGLSALSGWVESNLSPALLVVFKVLDVFISLGIITVLFAAIYKYLPDAEIRWSDVWHGAIMTAVLFVIAKFLLGIYFGNSDPASAYGAAGSIILIMLWVTYSGMVLLFGAEFTQVYARSKGHQIRPAKGAISTEGRGDNGAIVNKKSQAQARADAEAGDDPATSTRKSYREPRGSERDRGERKPTPNGNGRLTFKELMVYLVKRK